jgi:hypothetical protein
MTLSPTRPLTTYLNNLPQAHQEVFMMWFDLVDQTLTPLGDGLDFTYKMPTFSIPLSLYPQGYLNTPMIPIVYVSIAAQKNTSPFIVTGCMLINIGITNSMLMMNKPLVNLQTLGKAVSVMHTTNPSRSTFYNKLCPS